MWVVLRYAPGAITAIILTPARLTDTMAPAGSGAGCLSAPDPGITAGMVAGGAGAMVMLAITAGAAVTAADIVAVTDTTDIAAAMPVGVQGLERPVAIAAPAMPAAIVERPATVAELATAALAVTAGLAASA